jgi:DNA invertase Pin-like site-specific DNA recombinase
LATPAARPKSKTLAAQRNTLRELGVTENPVYLDHGMTGRSRKRPGLEQALAAVRIGDTLVVPKLDRLARSVPDARAIGDALTASGVRLSIGGTIYDPTDPMGKMFFNLLATFAEFEVDLLRMRTREGMAIARANGKLKRKQPKLSSRQRVHVLKLVEAGDHTIAELAELFAVSRATIYREIARARPARNVR